MLRLKNVDIKIILDTKSHLCKKSLIILSGDIDDNKQGNS